MGLCSLIRMTMYFYLVWIFDPTATWDDEDREWSACFFVDAPSSELARQWGDHLATGYCQRNGEQFIRSLIERDDVDPSDAHPPPVIRFGYEAPDDEIGW